MVDTVRVARRTERARTATAAVVALAAALVASSAATLALVGAVGAALPAAGAVAAGVAALCVLLALGDALGRPVRPQIPLQVPERWRRTLPLPVATFLYGLLLGTGFSSAVPAFAAWGLLLLVGAGGSTTTGAVAGLALGIGRAAPIVVGASLAERPGGFRAVRLVAAAALLFAAAGPLAGSGALAAPAAVMRGADPSVAGGELAWQQPGARGVLRRVDGSETPLPGDDPALGGALVAWHDRDTVTVAERSTLQPRFSERIVGVRQLALSDRWLVLRVLAPDRLWRLVAQSLADTSVHRVVAEARPPATLGRPSVWGDVLVYATSSARESSITSVDLASGRRARVRASRTSLLLNPSLLGGQLLYDELARCAQTVRLGPLAGSNGRVLYRLPPLAGQDAGHEHGYVRQGERTPCNGKIRPTPRMLWTTALDVSGAYVTVFPARAGRAQPTILSLPR